METNLNDIDGNYVEDPDCDNVDWIHTIDKTYEDKSNRKQKKSNNDSIYFMEGSMNDIDDLNLSIQKIDSAEISFHQLNAVDKCKMIGKYVIGEKIGYGSYGKVKEALDTETLLRRAIKIYSKCKLKKIFNGEKHVFNEFEIMSTLSNINILNIIEYFQNENKEKIYCILEYCICSLQDIIEKLPSKKFPLNDSRYCFKQLINGVDYLHSRGIIHKDIKPSNLLLNTEKVLKICDFGVAEALNNFIDNDFITSSHGTPAFQPPEVANGLEKFSGSKLDVWSCGVTLYILTMGTIPFDGNNIYKLFDAISDGKYIPPDVSDGLLIDLIGKMLNYDFEERITINQIKHHGWYNVYQHDNLSNISLYLSKNPSFNPTTLPVIAKICSTKLPNEIIQIPAENLVNKFESVKATNIGPPSPTYAYKTFSKLFNSDNNLNFECFCQIANKPHKNCSSLDAL